MKEIVELDPVGYHRILHAALRADNTAEEVTRASEVLKWVGQNIAQITQVMVDNQARLFGIVWNHWMKHGTPTNRVFAEELARQADKPDGLVALLEEYDIIQPSLVKTGALDMPQVLDDRRKDWERVRMLIALAEAHQITVGSLDIKPKPGEQRPKGARDAANYLFGALHKGVIVVENPGRGGSAKEDMPDIILEFRKNQWANRTGKLQIRTGLVALDKTIRGLRPKEFVGVMGFAGQFKTTLCRTFLYNAANQGLRSLHIPLESTYDEELMLYGIMHAHHEKFKPMWPEGIKIDRSRYDDGELTEDEVNFLEQVVIPDFKNTIAGDLLIRQPTLSTWSELEQIIDMEDREGSLDLVLIDYLALCDVSEDKNTMMAINNIIKSAKRKTLNHRGGEGLTIITPVQGKREGYEEAQKNDGVWRVDAAYMYSEFEKSVDKMLYVYTDDDLSSRA